MAGIRTAYRLKDDNKKIDSLYQRIDLVFIFYFTDKMSRYTLLVSVKMRRVWQVAVNIKFRPPRVYIDVHKQGRGFDFTDKMLRYTHFP